MHITTFIQKIHALLIPILAILLYTYDDQYDAFRILLACRLLPSDTFHDATYDVLSIERKV
jgi:hypothetical protein